jgi:hypothetical protein
MICLVARAEVHPAAMSPAVHELFSPEIRTNVSSGLELKLPGSLLIGMLSAPTLRLGPERFRGIRFAPFCQCACIQSNALNTGIDDSAVNAGKTVF